MTAPPAAPVPAAPRLLPNAPPEITVKLDESVSIANPQDVAGTLRGLRPWDDLVRAHPGLSAVPTFPHAWTTLDAHVRTALFLTPTYSPPNFKSYLLVRCPAGTDVEQITDALRRWPHVIYATVSPVLKHSSPVAVLNPQFVNQGYLSPAPVGIGATEAWQYQGGDGSSEIFSDVEGGWMLDHVELRDQQISLVYGMNDTSPSKVPDGAGGYWNLFMAWSHGTAMLGIILGQDNDQAGIGVVPSAAATLFSISTGGPYSFQNVTNAITAAISSATTGQVILLEQQIAVLDEPGYRFLPVEGLDEIYQQIKLASAMHLVIVEAAGNGGYDLDAHMSFQGLGRIFDPTVRHSGAIMVGACDSQTHSTLPGGENQGSNYGSRRDHARSWKAGTVGVGCGLTAQGRSGGEAEVAGEAGCGAASGRCH